jgi:hypothetical protein
VSNFKLNRRQKLVLFLAWRTSEYDLAASHEALRKLHQRIRAAPIPGLVQRITPISHNAALQWISLSGGAVLLLAILGLWPNLSWLMLPSAVCFAIGVRVTWNRARDALGVAAGEQMRNPTFGHHDPGDVLVREDVEDETEDVSLNRAESQYTLRFIGSGMRGLRSFVEKTEGTRRLSYRCDMWGIVRHSAVPCGDLVHIFSVHPPLKQRAILIRPASRD